MGFFSSLLDMRVIVPFNHCVGRGCALVARIGAQIVLSSAAWHFQHHLVQRSIEQFYVMCVCAAGDER
jgi:hypothetical protein